MICAVVGVAGVGVAQAGRKRVVVLDFEGPKSGRFHDDLVRIIKKTHNVVSTDKWNGTAEELDASEPTDKNIKKVAHKLKVDAVIEGKIEKRRDEFIIRLKLHSGASGALVGNPVDTKAEGPKIDGRAQRDIKDELLDSLDGLSGGGGGTADDDDDKPVAKKGGKKPSDDDDDKPVAKKGGKAAKPDDDDDKPAKPVAKKVEDDDKPAKPVAKKPSDDDDKLPPKVAAKKPSDDDDKLPPKKGARKPDDDDKPVAKPVAKKPTKKPVDDDDDDKPRSSRKHVATREGDGNDLEADAVRTPLDAATALSPGERAVDATLGISMQMRQLTFKVASGLRQLPPSYRGKAVPGYAAEATVYPLAFGHTRNDQLKNIGINVSGDRVFKLNTQVAAGGKIYHSFDSRFGFGAVYRYAFGQSPTAPVVLGSLSYNNQQFSIASDSAKNLSGIPNVRYKFIEPAVGIRFPITRKIIANLDGKIMAMLDTGQIQAQTQYGTSKITGFEGALSADYLVTANIFVRALFHAETIGYTFQGNGTLAGLRDGDPMTKDVLGARDNYIGGMVSAGYVY